MQITTYPAGTSTALFKFLKTVFSPKTGFKDLTMTIALLLIKLQYHWHQVTIYSQQQEFFHTRNKAVSYMYSPLNMCSQVQTLKRWALTIKLMFFFK